jgi:hypothetical protein
VIQISAIRVRSFDLDHLDVMWEIDSLPHGDGDRHEIYDYAFYVLRAGDSPLGPYEVVGGPLVDTYVFRDVSVSLLHKLRQYYYKVKVVHLPTGEEAEFGPEANDDPEHDLLGAEIIRNEDMLLREFIGRKCWMFPIRTFGPWCSCFDATLGRTTRSNHGACFGTGYLGGFMSPVEVYVQVDPNPKNSQLSLVPGETHQNDTTARMSAFPPAKPGDILVESENKRWRVMSVSPTERLRATIHQELRLHHIPKGDVEYALPVKVDLRELNPAAERNFTNPTKLERDDDYSDIFSGFGYRVR